MKKFATLALSLAVLMLVAQASTAQPEPNDVGIFADPAGTISTLDFPGGQTTFYVVAWDLEGQPNGYEFGIDMSTDFIISNTVWWAPDGVTPTVFGDARNAQVGSGGCLDGTGTIVLAEVTIGTFVAVGPDTEVCIGPSSPSSFDPAVPGYNTCDNVLIPFGVAQNAEPNYPNGCLILNATQEGPVATENSSFGEVKARF